MKNILLLFSTVFFLFSSMVVVAQQVNLPQPVSAVAPVELVSFEAVSPVDLLKQTTNSNAVKEQLIQKKCESIVCSTNQNRQIDLDNEVWQLNQNRSYENKGGSVGDWQFNLGPDEKSYYLNFIPEML